jgi:hypothetical protein
VSPRLYMDGMSSTRGAYAGVDLVVVPQSGVRTIVNRVPDGTDPLSGAPARISGEGKGRTNGLAIVRAAYRHARHRGSSNCQTQEQGKNKLHAVSLSSVAGLSLRKYSSTANLAGQGSSKRLTVKWADLSFRNVRRTRQPLL